MKRVAEPSSNRHGAGAVVMDGLLILSEFAEQTGIKLSTLRNWRDCRKYPQFFVRIGGLLFVNIQEFDCIVKYEKEAARRSAAAGRMKIIS
ncbi:MAG: hypothetical protein R6W92_08230 [Desulfocurvibacter africanus]